MLKAAIIAPNSLPVPPIRGGGIQTLIAETTPLYKEFKPYVFSICEYGLDKLPLLETVGNVEHHRICQSHLEELRTRILHLSTRNYYPYVHAIAKQIKEIKPNIIHIMNRPWFIPILRRELGNNVKIILHHHNQYFAEMNRMTVARYLTQLDAFAGISNFTVMEELLKRFPQQSGRCYTIYNGVNIKKFKSDPVRGKETRQRYGIKEDETVLLFAGRLRKEKGIHTLLEAAGEIIRENKKVKLMIVGSHFYNADTRKTPFIEGLMKHAEPIKDNVIFTGFITPDNMPDIYNASNILIVPSHTEAFGLTYAEAGATGIPVIGTKVGGIPEVVDNGITGLLMNNPEDVKELVHQIKFYLKNPDKMKLFGEHGRLRIEKYFSVEATAAKTEEMYKKVLSSPNRS